MFTATALYILRHNLHNKNIKIEELIYHQPVEVTTVKMHGRSFHIFSGQKGRDREYKSKGYSVKYFCWPDQLSLGLRSKATKQGSRERK